jgi:tetratricopeptide (TPR) repeat protein
MFLALILTCGLLGADDRPPAAGPPAQSALDTYKAAKAKVGKNADAHVRLALWCEQHGLSSEQMKHLALAVFYDPTSALARGLLGQVSYSGKWGRPEDAIRAVHDDPERQALINEYLDRRVKTASKADAQLRLAAWCDQNGLKDQAVAHYNEVIRLDPAQQAAWRHLGYKKQGGQWVKPEEAAAEKKDAERQKRADRAWRPKLERLRDGLTSRDPARRNKAQLELAEVSDSGALPMIWAVFLRGNERLQIAAVQMLSQIDGPAASNALAVLAIFNSSADVRRRAAESLARRDPRDVVGRLIGLIRKPFKYRYTPPGGPGTTGELFVEGEKFNIDRFYNNRPVNPEWIPRRLFAPSVPFDPYSVQNVMLAAVAWAPEAFSVSSPATTSSVRVPGAVGGLSGYAGNPNTNPFFWFQLMAERQDQLIARAFETLRQDQLNLEQQMARDVQMIEMTNANIKLVNSRALPLLKVISGKDIDVEPEKWKGWWTDQLGYAYQSSSEATKPTYSDFVSVGSLAGPVHSACFAAGTLVKTIDGPRAIESIKVGDRVLAQNTAAGDLAFQPVLVIHRNEPTATLRIALGDETIVATPIHRFWKPGKGWTMARELKAGDPLRMVGGVIKIQSIEPGETQPVYNLDVAVSRNFFVGNTGLLVHDFSFVQPVTEPFDRPADLGAVATGDAGLVKSTP